MALGAFSEMVSLGAILPLLSVLAAPEKAFELRLVASLGESFGITRADQLILPLALLFALAALSASGVRLLLLWTNARLANAIGHDLCVEVYRRTLYQPYAVHTARNTSHIISGVSKARGAVGVMSASLNIMTAVSTGLVIIWTLFFINPLVASASFAVLGATYVGTMRVTRHRLQHNGQEMAAADIHRLKALREGLDGIRDVLLDGSQALYSEIFRRANLRMSLAQAKSSVLSRSPQLIVEMVGMVGVAAIAYGLSLRPGGVAAALPVLGVFILGARRLVPALQQLYGGWATIKSSQASIADMLMLLEQPIGEEYRERRPEPLEFQRAVEFRNVSFRYQPTGPWVLDKVSLSVAKGTRVGVIGMTGGGKSTALDLLIGLLEPTLGDILIDGEPLTAATRRAWQQTLANVPQSIYLSDATVAENIAFGVPWDAIDMARVRRAARQAQIADFIEGSPEGYGATVGERGLRLSGGQRQRVGIARALYKQASVLVFDEATSALDMSTESAVIEAIEGLGRELTILMIAHRLTTVRRCDKIIQLERGRVVAQGTYEELVAGGVNFPGTAQVDSQATRTPLRQSR
jgi:ATP-binding cassette subfamily B protein